MRDHSFIRVRWHHKNPNDPVELLSELNAGRWETRKIEFWADGRTGFADEGSTVMGTRLGLVPVPSNQEIDADTQFSLSEISKDEFEKHWAEVEKLNQRKTT